MTFPGIDRPEAQLLHPLNAVGRTKREKGAQAGEGEEQFGPALVLRVDLLEQAEINGAVALALGKYGGTLPKRESP